MSENELFIYVMANEKVIGMLSAIEMTMDFMDEYGIKPDEEVIQALLPVMNRVTKWMNLANTPEKPI